MSSLSDLAAGMSPGTWAELVTTGIMQGNGRNIWEPLNVGSYILEYTDEFKWDSVRHRGWFYGKTHEQIVGDPAHFGVTIYNESTNDWTTAYGQGALGAPDGLTTVWGHTYDHLALDQARGELWGRMYGQGKMYRYTIGTGQWDSKTAPTGVWGAFQTAAGVEYFPELDSVIIIDGDWGIFRYNVGTDTWTEMLNGDITRPFTGAQQCFAEYDHIHHNLFLGGGDGSNRFYKIDSNANITLMQAAPINLGIQQSIITEDPNTGHLIVLSVQGTMWEYNTENDTWTLQSSSLHPPFFANIIISGPFLDRCAASPIPEYGVQMYEVYGEQTAAKVYLYKHSASQVATLALVLTS